MSHIEHVSKQLSLLFSEDEEFPTCVYLFGQKSVGKSLCLQNFLKSRQWISSVAVHTSECYVNKILFDTIINAFNNHKPSHENDYQPYAKMDTIEEFLQQLSLLDDRKSYLIVVEEAEKLRDMEFNILPVLRSLRSYTSLNISCIFVSHIAFIKYSIHPMFKLHVPDYSKNDLIDIFTSNYKDVHSGILKTIKLERNVTSSDRNKQLEIAGTLNEDFFKNYLNIFLNVFYKATRDFTELQFLANKCFKSYYAPVLSGEIKVNDVTNLWRNITKVLKVSLQTGHLRIGNLPPADLEQKVNELSLEPVKDSSIKRFAQTLELPNYAKHLLIASFLASHNDAKFDRRLFMKHHGKQKKRNQVQQKAKVSERMNVQFGPKSFTIDRLLAIFYAILEEKVGLTCNLLSQISTLVDLNFLTFVSGENNIMEGNARLQSTIGLDFAINIGRVVGFNVKQYLTDFH